MRRVNIKKLIGITTTVPVEVIFAAGYRPVDLNNVFIGSADALSMIDTAEREGLPRSTCAWVKGIYAAAFKIKGLSGVLGVLEGDCSNTQALLELWQYRGLNVYRFSYPEDRNEKILLEQLKRLAAQFGVSFSSVIDEFEKIEETRKLAAEIDRMTWEDNLVSGFENHLFQVCCSDFEGDYNGYGARLNSFIRELSGRNPFNEKIRLGYLGVPPVFPDIYGFLEELGARVVYNEVQREFTLINKGDGLPGRYLEYTYPYDIFNRLERIKDEAKKRKIHGFIHYTQSFCYRSLQDIILKKELELPVLTLEGDRPGGLDERSKMRIRNYIEMLESAG